MANNKDIIHPLKKSITWQKQHSIKILNFDKTGHNWPIL